MRTWLLVVFFTLSSAGCAYRGTVLAPPATRLSQTQVGEDMRACLAESSKPRVINSAERELVAGKETARLFMNGRPVVNPDGNPALHQSLLPQSANEQADRYAVCLLSRGYKWQSIQ